MEYLALLGAIVLTWFILVVLFSPAIPYRLRRRVPPESGEFLHLLRSLSPAEVFAGNHVEILKNGVRFYPAMLAAIAEARHSVNLECYIFERGEIADRFVEALAERARASVQVRVVADALGSLFLFGAPLRRLREAGCEVHFYQGVRWDRLHRLNNRTHREVLVIDGRIAFLGGAGIADSWWRAERGRSPWRDTMVRVEGPVVAALQGVFAENLLECGGEILAGEEFFPPLSAAGGSQVLVIRSSPSDRATVSRVLFQSLVECSTREVNISTPYFLPDKRLRRALLEAAGRGVRTTVLVPGPRTDQRLVRLASRRWYGRLLEAGIEIFEYPGAMMHQKLLVVDGGWTVIGTTNIDNRSFEHNDEVNIAVRDPDVVERCRAMYREDLNEAARVTAEAWRARPLWEKCVGPFAWILERQQ